jgi:DNA-binding MarR family transcriptional regulator
LSAQEVMDGLRRLVQVLRLSGREAEKRAGISAAQLFVLSKLADAGKSALSVNDLAERTLTHQSSVSVVVSRLVEGGLIERVTALEDQRRWNLSLTKKGKSLLRRAPVTAQDRIIEGVKRLPASRRGQLAKLLRELVVSVGVEKTSPVMFLEADGPRKGVGSDVSRS